MHKPTGYMLAACQNCKTLQSFEAACTMDQPVCSKPYAVKLYSDCHCSQAAIAMVVDDDHAYTFECTLNIVEIGNYLISNSNPANANAFGSYNRSSDQDQDEQGCKVQLCPAAHKNSSAEPLALQAFDDRSSRHLAAHFSKYL